MALTQLSNVIVPDVFANYVVADTMEKADIFTSGLVTPNAFMAGELAGGGKYFDHPFWNDLANTESVIPTDATSDVLSPLNVTASSYQWARQIRVQGWSTAKLVEELAGSDPMQRIASRVGAYWARQFNRITLATLKGVLADNVANDSSDMLLDITGESGNITVGGVTVAAKNMNPNAILEAKNYLGDEAESLAILIVHSDIATNLQKQNLIAYIPNSQGVVNIPTYLGYRLLVTDTAPKDANSSDWDYTSYLCAPGILEFAEHAVDEPVHVHKEPMQGRGMGVEVLINRRQFALHPRGFSFVAGSVAGQFPTNAELATAANWNRTAPERKQVPWVAIKSQNG